MSGIKNFLYLDEYKMYSISAQIFEGLTESLTNTRGISKEEEERQKGPLGSGRVIAEIWQQESQQQERKFFHDYTYTLFEKHLKDNEKVTSVTADSISEIIPVLNGVNFIEVRAPVIFNDMNTLKATISGFNELGEAFTYLSNFETIATAQKEADEIGKNTNDRNQRARIRERAKAFSNIAKMADDAGLRQDPTLLKYLAFLLEYGFQDQFEVRMPVGEYVFSGNLKREYLREDEQLLVRKFSRFPDRDFVLFGIVAQAPTPVQDDVDDDVDNEGSQEPSVPGTMKEAMMGVVQSLADVEENFTGRLANEVVVDPIALYREF